MKLRLTILKEPAGFLGQNVLNATTILLYFFDILCFHWPFCLVLVLLVFLSKKEREVMQVVVLTTLRNICDLTCFVPILLVYPSNYKLLHFSKAVQQCGV